MFENLFAERGLSLDRLRAFLETAEAGGIARAVGDDIARQSQYSRQIGELESFFGTRLVQRRGRRLELTAAGRELAAAVRAQLRGLSDFKASIESKPVDVMIGAGDSILTWLIIPHLAAIQRQFPGTAIKLANLRSTTIVERLAEFQLDYGVVRSEILGDRMASTLLGKVEYRLFVPKAMAGRQREKEPLTLLGRLPLVTLGSDGEFMRRLSIAAGKKKLTLSLPLITESFPQAARAVASGGYAGILPLYAKDDLLKAGARDFDHPVLRALDRKLVLAWNPRLERMRLDMGSLRDELVKRLLVQRG